MGDAAAVLGGMQAISRLDCRQRVVGLIPATENMTGPRAQRPGDVVRSYGGFTIEVLNTDAEGRLVLSDALGYAATLNPAAVVDVATLTGAVIVAFGHHAASLLGTDEPLLRALEAASAATGERVWRDAALGRVRRAPEEQSGRHQEHRRRRSGHRHRRRVPEAVREL